MGNKGHSYFLFILALTHRTPVCTAGMGRCGWTIVQELVSTHFLNDNESALPTVKFPMLVAVGDSSLLFYSK